MSRRDEEAVVALERSLSEEERELLDELAAGIAKRRLTPLALFFFESMKPLGYISSQILHFFRPVVSMIWRDPTRYDRLASILERRGSLELLLRRLEEESG